MENEDEIELKGRGAEMTRNSWLVGLLKDSSYRTVLTSPSFKYPACSRQVRCFIFFLFRLWSMQFLHFNICPNFQFAASLSPFRLFFSFHESRVVLSSWGLQLGQARAWLGLRSDPTTVKSN